MKEKYSAVLLAGLGGAIGLHKFYLGKITSGVLYAVFSWTFIPFLLSMIDRLCYLFMDKEKFDERYNGAPQQNTKAKHKAQKTNSNDESNITSYEQLKEAKALFDDGAINKDEYEAIKNVLIKNLEC